MPLGQQGSRTVWPPRRALNVTTGRLLSRIDATTGGHPECMALH